MRQCLNLRSIATSILVSAVLCACGDDSLESPLGSEGAVASASTAAHFGVYHWTMSGGEVVGYGADGSTKVVGFHVDVDQEDESALLVTMDDSMHSAMKVSIVDERGYAFADAIPSLIAEQYVSFELLEESAVADLVLAFNADARAGLRARPSGRRLIGACGASGFGAELEIARDGTYYYLINPPNAHYGNNKANVYVYMKGGGSGNDLKRYDAIQDRQWHAAGKKDGTFDGVHFIFDIRDDSDPRCTSRP